LLIKLLNVASAQRKHTAWISKEISLLSSRWNRTWFIH